jgi:hypothetical protein
VSFHTERLTPTLRCHRWDDKIIRPFFAFLDSSYYLCPHNQNKDIDMATYTITLNERTTSGKAIKKSAMRHLCSKLLLTALISMLCATSFAHDIAVANAGKTIYYTFTNNNTELAVSYQGSSYNEFSDEYSGNVVIPKTVTYNGKTYNVTSIGEYAFFDCSNLTSITIPNSVTSIGQCAFSRSGLTSVEIPNSVTNISGYAFQSCSSLTSITIGNSVTNIGAQAFNACPVLSSVHISDLAAWCNISFVDANAANPLYYAQHLYLNGEEVKDLVIPNSVTSIGKYAFQGCSGLTSVTIPNSVTSINQSAFASCSSLTSVTIPNSVTNIYTSAFRNCSGLTSVTIPNSVTSIGSSVFYNCSSLTSVTIPNSVTSIGGSAFYNCSSLTSVTIPTSVTSIGSSAFYNCSSLTSVTIPNSVTSIGTYSFGNCSGLTSVTIPNSVTILAGAAFYNCSSLTSVTIPKSVTGIGGDTFRSCSNLTSVKVERENPLTIRNNTFTNRANATLYVPIGSKSAYQAADYWKDFKEIVEYDPEIILYETSVDDPASYPVTMDVKVQRTIKGGEWSTICLPFAMTGEQVSEAFGSVELADFSDYQATKKGDKTISIMINFAPVDAADGMEANHPYLIKTADDIDEFTASEVMLVPDEENAQTAFTTEEDGQTVSKGYMKGIYHAQTVVPADNLFVSANKFYYSTGKTKMMAYRAYFYLADRLDRNESASAKISFMFNESSTNRIEDVEVRPAASSAIFDIQGRKVADSADGLQGLPKGIYIINGKKVVR